ncbi:MAG: Rrf2 family transcriptional regulator [Kiritimatiellia bacterium]|nr:Rrf2 family transcriptional regulator [Kiritimatiellia bacterium]
MLQLSQTANYAIQAMHALARSDRPVRTLSCLASETRVPEAYLAKVMRKLRDAKLVTARPGVGGGLVLARSADRISLWEIGIAIEGDGFLSRCLLGQALCPGQGECPMHAFWLKTRTEIRRRIERLSLHMIGQEKPA